MNIRYYAIKASSSLMEFEFISVGKNGQILKVIQFSPTGIPGIYNLGFADKDVETGEISDTIISDNGDRQKILETVAKAVLLL